MDFARRQCIAGRLLLGDTSYQNSGPLMESFFLHGDYLYRFVDHMYAHIGTKNRRAIHLNRLLGFRRNEGEPRYPAELFVKGDHSRPQAEFVRTKEAYAQAKRTMFTNIIDILYA